MRIGSLLIEPTAIAFGAFVASALSAALWWLVRRRVERVWLPTIKIVTLPRRILPRLVLRLPPLLAFFCFLLAAFALVLMTTKPRTLVYKTFEPNEAKILIFCDLSASVAAHLTVQEYASRVAAEVQSLGSGGRISIATSARPDAIAIQDGEEAARMIRDQGFHRAGIRLGPALRQLLTKASDTNRLIIVSDRDQHSWSGFNWRYLLDDMDVRFLDVSRPGGPRWAELFIREARYVSAADGTAQSVDWDVDIARHQSGGEATAGAAREVQSELSVAQGDGILATMVVRLAAERSQQTVRLSWPATAMRSAFGSAPLVFRLKGNELGDGPDLEFRALPRGLRQEALVVSAATGERWLEDPAAQLETSLGVLGFRVRRQDFLLQPGTVALQHPLVILLAGTGDSLDRYCPLALETRRVAAHAPAAAKKRQEPAPIVWLAPQSLGADWGDLCRCHARLLGGGRAADPAPVDPPHCRGVTSRAQFVGVLKSLGAGPVGGQVGDALGTLAWHSEDGASRLQVLAFSLPLTPSPETGITHGSLPMLVKELLAWQEVSRSTSAQSEQWPRIDDLSIAASGPWAVARGSTMLDDDAAMRWSQSNVPTGESLGGVASTADLPPPIVGDGVVTASGLPAKKDSEDPLPWLLGAAALAALLAGFEATVLLIGGMRRRARGRLGSRPSASPTASHVLLAALLGALSALAAPPAAEAKVQVVTVGGAGGEGQTLRGLAREVAQRTSVELAVLPLHFSRLTPAALEEPWIWGRDLSSFVGPRGELRPEVQTWLVRGGLLVLEAPLGTAANANAVTAALTRLTALLSGNGGSRGAGRWLPLPPDHELMRSFYLLEALPSCGADTWRGFELDSRLAILVVPASMITALADQSSGPFCSGAAGAASGAGVPSGPAWEQGVRTFVNIVMVALATDYKKDQIHLPEILKRLR